MKHADWELLGHAAVDSGQLLLVDPAYIDSSWTRQEFEDIRVYRHTAGATLQYRVDFNNYQDPIAAYGQTMNQLLHTGEWEMFEQPIPPGLNYSACCMATLSQRRAGQVDDGVAFSTGYGDGCYPVLAKRNADGRIMQVMIDFNCEE